MNIKRELYHRVCNLVRKSNLAKRIKLKDDSRESAPYKLVYFCGRSGMEYLNASLVSVYKSWKVLPELFIVSDGTPLDVYQKMMVKWPRNVQIIDWQVCADYFKKKGAHHIYNYAVKELWGKKFACIHYCAQHFPSLYCDTDVLWFSSFKTIDATTKPTIKMSEDVHACYTEKLITALNEFNCYETAPLNAGLMFVNGDLSGYTKWDEMCDFLADNRNLGGFSEQTANAIVNNYYDINSYWQQKDVLIKISDQYKLRYTKKDYPDIAARHYVSVKNTVFWRDFTYMMLRSRKETVKN